VLFTSENWSNPHRENPYSLKAVKQTKKTKGPFPNNNKTIMLIEHKTGIGFAGWFNRIPVIRYLPLRVTPIFANKNHALNTLKMSLLLRNNVMLP
jgi:hypothetical protein